MAWLQLAQGRDQWRVLVRRATGLHVQYNAGNLLPSEDLVLSPEELCSMELVNYLVSWSVVVVVVVDVVVVVTE